MSMVKSGIIKRSSCKSNAVSRVSVRQHKLVRARGNREVSEHARVKDQGQISRMMLSRLQDQGLVENTRGHTKGLEKAWRLTPHGEAVLDAHRPGPAVNAVEPAELSGGKLVAKRSHARPASTRPASAGFRLTIRTHLVLTAVAEHVGASSREIAKEAGIKDEGQVSKLLARLQDRGLIHNTARAGRGNPKAWQLTPQGEALLPTNRAHSEQAA